jgi:putative zinc finger/helix-turn-helix YgiT family protein
MMSNAEPTGTKACPFPWLCRECGKREIYLYSTDYRSTEPHDGSEYEIHIRDLEIPTCRNCGEQLITIGVNNRINAALREKAGLLAPSEIERRRTELGLSQQKLAEMLDISAEAIAKFEASRWIQSREEDNRLRSLFNRPAAPSTNGAPVIAAASEVSQCT